jgi:Exopolysaccharide biosynthesis protein related to N-acetylglucosamine-1-phosphodiester alpha-N-acetylglucosaminidase
LFKSILKWAAIGLMLAALAFFVVSPALAEVVTLPLEGTGFPPVPEGFLSDSEYQDDSIYVSIEKVKASGVECMIARIVIADPSQLRTAMSDNRYDKTVYVKALTMSKAANAVISMNGDFFKYHNYGYLVRQGELYRERPNGEHDVLLIDNLGDFHVVQNGTEETVKAFLDELPEELSIVNSFNFGPLLVKDGETVPITTTMYQYRYPMQRLAIVQYGDLEYAIVHCNGKHDATAGMTLARFGEFIAEQIPEARIAYNLDGGGSAHVIFNNKVQHKTPDARNICDILYFASAVTPQE